ncbi:GIY-YIG nuclease family domain protein [Candidatus Megaera polyxenophila]|nr:GIY-YIG nuclease family domain protein [Candidatus Megaera polyxenophila]
MWKIGLNNLILTSMPAPFRCVYAAEVNDVVIVEKRIHKIFIDKRIRRNIEFFEKVSLEQLIEAIKLAELREVTPKNDIFNEPLDKEVLEKCSEVEERKNKWAFKDLRIPINFLLIFLRMIV